MCIVVYMNSEHYKCNLDAIDTLPISIQRTNHIAVEQNVYIYGQRGNVIYVSEIRYNLHIYMLICNSHATFSSSAPVFMFWKHSLVASILLLLVNSFALNVSYICFVDYIVKFLTLYIL